MTIPPDLSPQSTHQIPDFTTVRPRFTKRHVLTTISHRAILFAISGVLYLALGGCANTPEAQVRQVINDFATAVDTEDQAKIVELLCTEEAANITEDDDYDPTANGSTLETATRLDRQISEIHITDEAASAKITFPNHESIIIDLRQENGIWHICAPPPK